MYCCIKKDVFVEVFGKGRLKLRTFMFFIFWSKQSISLAINMHSARKMSIDKLQYACKRDGPIRIELDKCVDKDQEVNSGRRLQ